MIRQLDGSGNVVLVLTPQEASSLLRISLAAGYARAYGIAEITETDRLTMSDLMSGAFKLSDDVLIDCLQHAHADHEGDDMDTLLEYHTNLVTSTREILVEAGLAE